MPKIGSRRQALLVLGALGVVFGDIGTSPLYAINELFFRDGAAVPSRATVIGGISLVVWILAIVVTGKYVTLVLRADFEGEGGVLALFALLRRHRTPQVVVVSGALVVAAGLLVSEGVITPAISVLAAVEGLRVAVPGLSSVVVPIAVGILVGLFLLQSRGTARIGALFGPVLLTWFGFLLALGVREIVRTPEIWNALDPRHAVEFLAALSLGQLAAVLGSVVLVVTGCEALFADLGHFGRRPIRIAWLFVVFPALILNYLGQGAFVLAGGRQEGGTLFFSMVPPGLRGVAVVLATIAAVIASQALISGAFSLVTQGIALGLLPRIRVLHTHEEHHGQIYVPFVNWGLCIGSVFLVLAFRSSSNLAAAYGFAVSGVMAVTGVSVAILAHRMWRWPWALVVVVFAPLWVIDAAFLVANSVKVLSGAWIPLLVGTVLATQMFTWRWGRKRIAVSFFEHSTMSMGDVIAARDERGRYFPKSMLMFVAEHPRHLSDPAPVLLELFWKRFGALPRHVVLLTIRQVKRPVVPSAERYDLAEFAAPEGVDAALVAAEARFGFMEDVDIESVISDIAADPRVGAHRDLSDWIIHAGKERVTVSPDGSWFARVRSALFKTLARNAEPAYEYFGLEEDARLSVELVPVQLG